MSQDIARWLEEAGTFEATIHCRGLQKKWDKYRSELTDIQCAPDQPCNRTFPVHLNVGHDSLLDNWLMTGDGEKSSRFRFQYHSSETNRIYVSIHGTGANQSTQLDISRNGYLGLYANASNIVQMKLEPLEWGEDTLHCRIRDHQGHTVKAAYENLIWLNVQKGDDVTFVITRLKG